MAPPILSLEDVRLHHGDGILFQDLTLHVGPRDRLALIGRNGAGKTTLFRTIAGDLELDGGSRTVMPGVNIVWLHQDPDMSGYESLLDWAISGADAPAQHKIEAIADQMGIDLTREAATASGGERRRAALSRALAMLSCGCQGRSKVWPPKGSLPSQAKECHQATAKRRWSSIRLPITISSGL